MSKEFDPSTPSQGLGDTIAKVTHFLGIDTLAQKVAEAVGEEDCGCNKRREALNNLVPYTKSKNLAELRGTAPNRYRVRTKISFEIPGNTVTYSPGDILTVNPGDIIHSSVDTLLAANHIELIQN
jgi:hypothetical protein